MASVPAELTAVFRPDRPPQEMHLLYDLGMLSFNGSLGCFTAAYLALAIAILYDKNRIFPKWFAYIQLWQIVTEVWPNYNVYQTRTDRDIPVVVLSPT